MKKYVLGLDYGTLSERTVLVDIETGKIDAVATYEYRDSVIDEYLPGSDKKLPNDWALQNPIDYLNAVELTIAEVLKQVNQDEIEIVGIGVDFTACTILPVKKDGTPLCMTDEYKENPHAWVKLWKHHAAQKQADFANEVAEKRGEAFLPRYGNIISSEWAIPKVMQIVDEAPEIYKNADYFVEASDWIIWRLTGELTRNACAAGYKGTWHKKDGYPSKDYLKALNPVIENLYDDKLCGSMVAPGEKVGNLSNEWKEKFNLSGDIAVGGPIIDAHSAAIGGGVSDPGTMFMIMGTSTCHMLMSDKEVLVDGISGVVEDGIVPGYYGYEAGQAAVGDIFGWFVNNNVPAEYQKIAEERGVSIHDVLSEKASKLNPGESGLLAVDWWNGCRTPLVDAHLSGMILGLTLNTKPEEIYRALIEATAFGTRVIIELFSEKGVKIDRIRAGGGLTKNQMLLEIYADIIGLPIEISASEQASALGAAVLGAVAADQYSTISDAVEKMVEPPVKVVTPNIEKNKSYNKLYEQYKKLVDIFGRDENSVIKELYKLKG